LTIAMYFCTLSVSDRVLLTYSTKNILAEPNATGSVH
jgi:hypothetical protein